MSLEGNAAQLLVVEDDQEMGELLHRGLSAEGYLVAVAVNGVDALIASASTTFSVAIVDVMLPGMTGFEVCRRIKETSPAVRVLLLTARDSVDDRVFGLDSGADDYLTKPFAFAELSARVRALLRRDDAATQVVVTVGPLRLDSLTLVASVGESKIPLSPKEFALLRLLATHYGQPVTRAEILDAVWGGGAHIDNNIVDQYVSYLRRKLGAASDAVGIATVRGKGYLLEAAQ